MSSSITLLIFKSWSDIWQVQEIFLLSKNAQTGSEAHTSSYAVGTLRGLKMGTKFHLVPRLKMGGPTRVFLPYVMKVLAFTGTHLFYFSCKLSVFPLE
jgi:hypothetical protein